MRTLRDETDVHYANTSWCKAPYSKAAARAEIDAAMAAFEASGKVVRGKALVEAEQAEQEQAAADLYAGLSARDKGKVVRRLVLERWDAGERDASVIAKALVITVDRVRNILKGEGRIKRAAALSAPTAAPVVAGRNKDAAQDRRAALKAEWQRCRSLSDMAMRHKVGKARMRQLLREAGVEMPVEKPTPRPKAAPVAKPTKPAKSPIWLAQSKGIAEAYRNSTVSAVARQFGLSKTSIKNALAYEGIDILGKSEAQSIAFQAKDTTPTEAVVARWRETGTLADTGKAFGKGKDWVRRRLVAAGVDVHKEAAERAARHIQAARQRESDAIRAKAPQMWALRHQGLSYEAIGERIGHHWITVKRVLMETSSQYDREAA